MSVAQSTMQSAVDYLAGLADADGNITLGTGANTGDCFCYTMGKIPYVVDDTVQAAQVVDWLNLVGDITKNVHTTTVGASIVNGNPVYTITWKMNTISWYRVNTSGSFHRTTLSYQISDSYGYDYDTTVLYNGARWWLPGAGYYAAFETSALPSNPGGVPIKDPPINVYSMGTLAYECEYVTNSDIGSLSGKSERLTLSDGTYALTDLMQAIKSQIGDRYPDIVYPGDPVDEITTDRHNNETSLPVLSGIRTVSGDAFSTFYHLSMYHIAEMGQLISQMPQTFWEALGTATDYKQANILDYLISLKWYPLNIVDNTDTVTSDVQFGFSGLAKITFTAAGTSYKIGNINRIYDMGTITVPYRTTAQSFLDLEPYTTVSAYLPYIGTVSLQANDVLGYTITCTYVVDLTTGMCTGILTNDTDTIYIGTGKIGVDISVSGNDILTQSEKMASSYIGAAAGVVNNTLSLSASTAAGDAAGMISASASAVTSIAASAISIANSKRGIPETVGSASGFGGGYTHQSPYIRVQRPAVSIPAYYGHDVGYICNRTYTIGRLSGYTVCSNPDLSGISATAAELDMIKSILCTGFYA